MSIRKVQESTSHAARKRTIIDYPKATYLPHMPQQRKPPRSLLAALTARHAHCSPRSLLAWREAVKLWLEAASPPPQSMPLSS